MEFIDGVTLLNTIAAEAPTNLSILLGVSIFGFILFFIITILSLVYDTDTEITVAFAMGFLAFLFISMILGFATSETENLTIQYQVTIDETVSMQEFIEHYDIVKVEGQIYTITIKEQEDR